MNLNRWFLLLILPLVLSLGNAYPAPRAIQVQLIHTNDLHGRLLPDKAGKAASDPQKAGGLAELAGLIKSLKKNYPGKTILLDGGDFAQGTLESNYFYGEPEIRFFNYLGYDALELGNHDFDWGLKQLQKTLKSAEFAVLGANIKYKVTGKHLSPVKPYLVKEIAGVKIGIIGVITPETPKISKLGNVEGILFFSPVKIIRACIAQLKAKGVKTFIVLSHCGIEEDEEIARQVPQINLIVGAHSHTWLQTPVKIGKTLILQAYCYGRVLGAVNLTIDKATGEIVGYRPQATTIPILAGQIKPDQTFSQILAPYLAAVKSPKAEVRGYCRIVLNREGAYRGEDSLLGDLITDAMREATKAQAAVYNLGGIRSDFGPGPITYGEIFSVLPFDDNTVTIKIRGAELQKKLEQSLKGDSATLQISGITFSYDPSWPQGKRIKNLEIAGEPLQPQRSYTIAITDFLLGGGDGFDFSQVQKLKTYPFPREILAQYLKRHSPIATIKNQRIVKLNLKSK